MIFLSFYSFSLVWPYFLVKSVMPDILSAFFISDSDLRWAEGLNLIFVKTSFFFIYNPRDMSRYLLLVLF